jgi:hypothetical protein
MTSLTKNLLVALGLLTIGFAGYYLYSQRSTLTVDGQDNEVLLATMRQNTDVFIMRSQELSKIDIDTSFFETTNFRSLKAYTGAVKDREKGRPDPFAEVGGESFITTEETE